ncbi:MAG TPA: hypothetical protein VH207_16300, partial [Chthoniobacterales bacterium]|nr:hypothetical protein [Chthoniobacterales bacterium]
MENINKSLTDYFKEYAGSWVTYSAFGSFLLYLLGYLVTRFELTMLGVAQNLGVLEERYLFAGARFLVYLLATIPSLLLLLLLPAAIVWVIARLLPDGVRARFGSIRARTFYLIGILFAIVVIQFVARNCFLFTNLLLAPSLPGPAWLQAVLLDDQDLIAPLFFAALVAATALTAAILIAGNRRASGQPSSRFLGQLLALLLAIQALFLPINYAVFIAHKSFARVTNLPPMAAGRAWLIWENNDVVTLFVLPAASLEDRALITLEAKNT